MEKAFLDDVRNHSIEIIANDEKHRHIRFKNPASTNCWFELITWPGTLCINGDCGTYVFSRLNDMFQFFRQKNGDDSLLINSHYWAEKLQAVDQSSGVTKFDPDKFRARVENHFDSFVESSLQIEDQNSLWESIESDVLSYSDYEHEAYQAVANFSSDIGGETFEFVDFFDGGGTETFTDRYLWCLYAIVWGIKQYDKEIANG